MRTPSVIQVGVDALWNGPKLHRRAVLKNGPPVPSLVESTWPKPVGQTYSKNSIKRVRTPGGFHLSHTYPYCNIRRVLKHTVY